MKYTLIFSWIFSPTPYDIDLNDYVTESFSYYDTMLSCENAAFRKLQIELVANNVDLSNSWERQKFKYTYICAEVRDE